MNFTPIHVLLSDETLTESQIHPSFKKRSGEYLKTYGKNSSSLKKRRREYSTENADESVTEYIPKETQGNEDYVSASDEDEDDMYAGKEETEDKVPLDNRSSNSLESDAEDSVNAFPMASTITEAIQSLPHNKEVSMAYLLIYVRNYLEKYPEATNVKKSRIATGIYESLANLAGFRKIRHGYYTYSPNKGKKTSTSSTPMNSTIPQVSSSAPTECSAAPTDRAITILPESFSTTPETSTSPTSSTSKTVYKTITYPDGSSYKGEFENNLKNGKGVLKLSNGDVYNGYWKNNDIYGQGTYTKSNGDVFKGTWTNGACGSGTLTTLNGDVYTGSWMNNKIRGQGKLVTKSGDRYEGDWVNSLMHGDGMCKTDKHVYTGSWKNGLPNGQGTSLYNDRTKLEGEFLDGVLHNGNIIDTTTNEHKKICNGVELLHDNKSKLPMEENAANPAEKLAVVEVVSNQSLRPENTQIKDKVNVHHTQQRRPERMEGVSSSAQTQQPDTLPTTDYDSQKLLLIRIKDLFNEELITKEDYKSIKQNILKKIMEV